MYHHNIKWLTEVWPLGSYPTVFQAELDAIGKLAVDLCKRNITNTEVIIQCNSKATIISLEMATVGSKTVLSTKSAVSDLLSQGNTVTICWVPGHVNVRGNKRADELAKLGTTHFCRSRTSFTAPPMLYCEKSMVESYSSSC